MEKNINEMLKEVLAGLTDEQKAKAAECKDVGALCELLGKMGVALPDELLDGAAGGFLWQNPGLGGGASGQNDGEEKGEKDPFADMPKRFF